MKRLQGVLLATVLFVGGCGVVDRGGDSSTPAPPPVTGQQLQEAAKEAYGADEAAMKELEELRKYKRENCSYAPDSTANNLCSEQGGFSREAKLAEARTKCQSAVKAYNLLAGRADNGVFGSLPRTISSQVINPRTSEKLTCAASK